MIKTLKNLLPRPVEQKLKRVVYYGALDLFESLTGRREDLVPPRRMIFIGGPAFKQIGDEFFGYFKDLCGLKPDAAVLDVGCGIGRMARPLTGYLSSSGKYEGFDIDPVGIKWCQENIGRRFPNFRFQRADIYNKHYNPNGKHKASEYRFPYADGAFDFAYLTSVFTHMFPEDIDQYLGEISRVLKSGGKALITFFLWNRESEDYSAKKKSSLDFKYTRPGYRMVDEKFPEDAVCLDEPLVIELMKKRGLKITATKYGNWCGRPNFLSYQDILIVEKV